MNPYQVLGITTSASLSDIDKSYNDISIKLYLGLGPDENFSDYEQKMTKYNHAKELAIANINNQAFKKKFENLNGRSLDNEGRQKFYITALHLTLIGKIIEKIKEYNETNHDNPYIKEFDEAFKKYYDATKDCTKYLKVANLSDEEYLEVTLFIEEAYSQSLLTAFELVTIITKLFLKVFPVLAYTEEYKEFQKELYAVKNLGQVLYLLDNKVFEYLRCSDFLWQSNPISKSVVENGHYAKDFYNEITATGENNDIYEIIYYCSNGGFDKYASQRHRKHS